MTALLTDNLPLLAGAPNGIKKLRELILELAVRGKLVPQDPSDEPASELLKQIAEEKARLVAERKIRRSKPLADINGLDKPYELPAGWSWTTLPGAASYQIGKTPPTKESKFWDDSGQPWVSISDMEHYGEINDTARKVSVLAQQDVFKYPPVPAGTLLMSFKLTVGKVAMLAVDAYHNEAIISLSPFCGVSKDYLFRFLPSIALGGQQKNALMGNTLNSESMAQLLVPIPPLAEQHRIVAKVDELMALCDRLEARQSDAESAHAQLVQALLDSLTHARDAEDFAQSWQRLAEHFHTLFTTESSIDVLKQTLMQLAVMGKLVPQVPSDEPASELLKRIAEEKARLISEEGLRTTAREDVPEAEHYFMLHAGWGGCRLGNLARFIDYRGRTPTKTSSGIPLITAKNVRPGFISREPQEFIADTDYLSWMTRGFPRVGDMLFTTEAPMGNVAIIDIADRFALAQRVICFQLHELGTGPFLKLAMMSSGFQAQLSDAATGMTATGIKSSRLKEIPVPIPPLAEQHRIVAKVDQLMALCDQLKTRLTQARQLNEQLATALVEQAVA